MLLTRKRCEIVLEQLQPYSLYVLTYLAFHFALVMYGGTNLAIFVTYALPVQIMVFVILLDRGNVRHWELLLVWLAVFVFNRLWMSVPLPEDDLERYLLRRLPHAFLRAFGNEICRIDWLDSSCVDDSRNKSFSDTAALFGPDVGSTEPCRGWELGRRPGFGLRDDDMDAHFPQAREVCGIRARVGDQRIQILSRTDISETLFAEFAVVDEGNPLF